MAYRGWRRAGSLDSNRLGRRPWYRPVMRHLGFLTLVGLAALTAGDGAAQPTGIPPHAPSPTSAPSPPPPGGPVAPPVAPGWTPPPMVPPPPNVTGAEGDLSPTAAGVMAVLATVVPVGIGFTMTALVERKEGEATIAGVVVAGTGVVIGPSIGHFYAGETGHALGTSGLRLLAFGNTFGLGLLGLVTMYGGNRQDSAPGWMLLGMAGISGAAGLGLVAYDLVDAPSAARRANREAQSAGGDRALVPSLTAGPTGGSLTWTF